MEMIKVIGLAIVIVGMAILGMAIKIVSKKGGKFPNAHIGGNPDMKSRGIYCAQTFDKIEQTKARKELKFKDLTLAKEE